nr:hypothetical protein CFP56_57594 [Quercus suber]
MHSPFVQPHELGDKSFEMEDDFAAGADPMLVECAPSHHISFKSIVDLRHELERERLASSSVSAVKAHGWSRPHLQNGRGRYAMGQQVVQFGSHLQDPRRRPFFDDFRGYHFDQRLPIWWWDDRLVGDLITIAPRQSHDVLSLALQAQV